MQLESFGALLESKGQRAAVKFERVREMYFTRDALEQASSEIVSRYRAGRFQELGVTSIADLGCGIGSDTLSLCRVGKVTGVEWNPRRLAMAQENLQVYELASRFHPLKADLIELSPLKVEALFADPGRWDEYGGRV